MISLNLIFTLIACTRAIQLKFSPQGKFRILQFTDTHFGESWDSDNKTMLAMNALLDAEDPDLIVYTGDAISGYAWDGK